MSTHTAWTPNRYTLGWLTLATLGIALQIRALTADGTDGKLSRHVEAARVHPATRPWTLAAAAWLGWHWLAEPALQPRWRAKSIWWPDIVVTAAAAAYGWATRHSTVSPFDARSPAMMEGTADG